MNKDNNEQPRKISGGFKNVPDGLFTKTQLIEKGLKPGPGAKPEALVYCARDWRKLYNIEDAVPKRQMSEKQKEGLEKARASLREQCTCDRCNEVQGRKQDMIEHKKGKYCGWCYDVIRNEEQIESRFKEALHYFRKWLAKDYVILDAETTGLTSNDQVVEISVISKHGEGLFHRYIKPSIPVSQGAKMVHGITDETLESKPLAKEVVDELVEIIKDKEVIMFNRKFLCPIINNSFTNTSFKVSRYGVCLMEAYKYLTKMDCDPYDDDTVLSLGKLVGKEETSRRSTEDCLDILKLIKQLEELTKDEEDTYHMLPDGLFE